MYGTTSRIWVFALAAAFAAAGCGGARLLSVPEYGRWADEAGISDRSAARGGFLVAQGGDSLWDFNATYLPLDWVMLRNGNGTAATDTATRKEYAAMQYYRLQVRSRVSERQRELIKQLSHSMEDYQQNLAYSMFYTREDFLLVDGGDTLRCIDALMERTFDLTPFIRYNLVFERPVAEQHLVLEARENAFLDKTLVFLDRLYTHDTLRFGFSAEVLNDIPFLKH